MTLEILDQAGDLDRAPVIFQQSNPAETEIPVFIKANFDRRLTGNADRDRGISRRPVGHALVDEGVERHALDLRPFGSRDRQCLAGRNGPRPVIAGQCDEWFIVKGAEAISERLDSTLETVLHLKQTANIQVNAFRRAPQQATNPPGGPWGLLRPVQVDQNVPDRVRVLAQADRLT